MVPQISYHFVVVDLDEASYCARELMLKYLPSPFYVTCVYHISHYVGVYLKQIISPFIILGQLHWCG